jgi:hypothetical protein
MACSYRKAIKLVKNGELVCIGHDLSIPTGHKVYQGSKKKSPRIPSFDFCFFIAVIDHIANTTRIKLLSFFSNNICCFWLVGLQRSLDLSR